MCASRFVAMAALSVAAVVALLCGTYPVVIRSASAQPIARNGCLGFHEVHPQIKAEEALRTQVPAGYRIYSWAGSEDGQKLLLREMPSLRGEPVDAQANFDPRTNAPIISFQFNAAGAREFEALTADNVGRQFAIVVGDRVISAPVIREPIRNGVGQISGNLTMAEAQLLVTTLKSGNCP